jgi:uncharacterized RDD family membrane protein YckC
MDANAGQGGTEAIPGEAVESRFPGWSPPPENERRGPAPGVAYAGFWIRFVAYLIDSIPSLIIAGLLIAPAIGAGVDAMREVPLPPPGAAPDSPEYLEWQRAISERMNEAFEPMTTSFFSVAQLFPIVYFIGFWTVLGQTPGMMLFGMHLVRDADGSPPGFGRSILRYVGYFVSSLLLFIGFIWVAFDRKKQGWHDKLAGTVVVRRVA